MANADDPRRLDPEAQAVLVAAVNRVSELLDGRARAAVVILLMDGPADQQGSTALGTALAEDLTDDPDGAGLAIAKVAILGLQHLNKVVRGLTTGDTSLLGVDLDAIKRGGS